MGIFRDGLKPVSSIYGVEYQHLGCQVAPPFLFLRAMSLLCSSCGFCPFLGWLFCFPSFFLILEVVVSPLLS